MRSPRPAELDDLDRQVIARKVQYDLPELEPEEPSAVPVDFLHGYVDGLLEADLEDLRHARDAEEARRLMHEQVEALRGYDFPDWPWLSAWVHQGLHRFVYGINWGLIFAIGASLLVWRLLFHLLFP